MRLNTRSAIRAIQIAAMPIDKRSTHPILTHMALQPLGDQVAFIGTDLDMEVTAMIPQANGHSRAWAGDPNACIAAPRRIAAALALGSDEVDIARTTETKEKTTISFRSGPLDMQALHLPYDDFPRLHTSHEPLAEIEMGTDHLDTMLRVMKACSTEETRYYLNGLYLHLSHDPSTVCAKSLRAVATDGHRLYLAPLALAGLDTLGKVMPDEYGLTDHKATNNRGMIIPRRAMRLLAQLRRKITSPIRLSLTSRTSANRDQTLAPERRGLIACFAFEIGDCKVALRTKLIDGRFPDYPRVIPEGEQINRVLVSRAKLGRAVRLIGATTGKHVKAIALTFEPDGIGRLGVSAKGVEDIVQASTWISAETNCSQPFTIGFNGNYLAELCEVSDGETLLLETNDQGSPTKITSPESTGFRAVLMPMRI